MLLLLGFFFSVQMYAQKKTITGVVLDSKSEPIIAASVAEANTTNGVMTNMDGKFSLDVTNSKNAVIISFLGYKTQTINIGTRTHFDIVLEDDSDVLEEVVVTGYGGTQSRAKLTNSISTVKKEMLENGVFSNPAQALSGAVAGLRVTQTSGRPGAVPAIILRGGTNLDGTGSPLVVVDGQIRDGLNDINSDDIESIEVLKDAGATAIYGARASNGVILVTTKSGKLGKTEVTLKARWGLSYMNNPFDFMNGADYLYWMRNAYKNAADIGTTNMSTLKSATPYGTGNLYWDPNNPTVPLDGNKDSRAVWSPMILDNQNRFLLDQGWKSMKDPIYGDDILYKEFDMSKEAFNDPSLSQDYGVSLSGGNEKSKYFANIGYLHQEGVPVKTFYKLLTATLNADYKIKDWLTSTSTFNFADARWKDIVTTSEANYFGRMLSTPPTMRGYNANGELLLGPNLGDGNPNKNIDAFNPVNNTDKFSMGQSLKIDIMSGLWIKASALLLYQETHNENFTKDYLKSPNNWDRTRSSSAYFDRTVRQTYNLVANFNKKVAENHNINILLGGEFYESYNKGFSASGSGAPTDDFMALELTSSEENKREIKSWHNKMRILSFLGRVNYDFRDKYLFTFTFRQDGYSMLLDNRWGFFPGVSGGWIISKENFMENLSNVISNAKLRASYGVNGNASGLGYYELQGSYGTSRYNGSTGYRLSKLPNPTMKWERSNTFEVGIDLGFLSKYTFAATFYNRITTDKYADISLPISSGFSGIRSNNGSIRNRGLEMEVGAKVLSHNDWTWNINANIAYNKNTIIKLPDNGLERNRQNAFEVYDGTSGRKWVGGYQEGQSPGELYAHVAQGIYKSEEEVMRLAGDRIDKTSGNNGSNGKILYGPNAWAKLSEDDKKKGLPIQPGDVIWKDVNGDGSIDNFDQEYVGNMIPPWGGGFTSNLTWKNLSLFIRLDYALGHHQVDYIRPWFMGAMQGTYNSLNDTKDTWTSENTNAPYPKYYWADQLGKRNYARQSTMFIYKSSYLAFREIALSYILPKAIVQKAQLNNVQLSLTLQNLGYMTSSKIYTPEMGGGVNAGYGLPRTIVFGATVTF